MKTRTKKKVEKDRYLELVGYVPLRPIRSESELDEAINMVDYLIDREKLSVDEKDYLDVLADIIERYETEHIKFPRLPEGQMLNYLIENKGVAPAQVAKDCRLAAATISEIVDGTRKMTRNHIAKFSAYFHVNPGVFFDD